MLGIGNKKLINQLRQQVDSSKEELLTIKQAFSANYLGGLLSLNYPSTFKNYSVGDYQQAIQDSRPLADAVNKISEKCITINPLVYSNQTSEYVETDFIDLLQNPNPFCNYSVFIKQLITSYLVFGNGYYIVSMNGNTPILITNVANINVSVQQNMQDGYASVYTVNGTDKYKRDIDNLYRNDKGSILFNIRDMSMCGDWRLQGQSRLRPIIKDIELLASIYQLNQSLMQNEGRPSGSIEAKDDAEFTDEQRDSLKEQFTADFSGVKKAGNVLTMPTGFTFKPLSLSPKDMDYQSLVKMVTQGIYNTFNIPLSLINSDSLSLANMEVAMTHLYINAVIPTIKTVFASFTHNLLPFYFNQKGVYEVTFNSREIEALQTQHLQSIKQEMDLGVITINEAREKLGYEPKAGGDQLLIASNLVPLGDDEFDEPAPTDEPADNTTDNTTDDLTDD